VNDNLHRVVRALDREKLLDVVVLLRAALPGVHFDHTALVPALEELLALDELLQVGRVFGVFGYDQHERLYFADVVLLRIDLEIHLGRFVHADAVLELEPL